MIETCGGSITIHSICIFTGLIIRMFAAVIIIVATIVAEVSVGRDGSDIDLAALSSVKILSVHIYMCTYVYFITYNSFSNKQTNEHKDRERCEHFAGQKYHIVRHARIALVMTDRNTHMYVVA